MKWTEGEYAAYKEKIKRLSPAACHARELAEARANLAKRKPSRNQPNKTERRFEMEILRPSLPEDTTIGFQSLTFLLAPNLRYTPDWTVWFPDCLNRQGQIVCYEVKGGHVWDDARVKFLTARKLFPWITWQAFQYKNKAWLEIWKE